MEDNIINPIPDIPNSDIPNIPIIKQKIVTGLSKQEYNKKYNKKYYELKKDYWKQKHDCECGAQYIIGNKTKHLQSKKHAKGIIEHPRVINKYKDKDKIDQEKILNDLQLKLKNIKKEMEEHKKIN